MPALVVHTKEIIDKFNRDEGTVYAAQASFFIIIAFFPFIMLLLTLVQLIPAIQKSDLLEMMLAIMPDMLDSLVAGIIDDLYTKSPGTIISLSGIAAIWSASRGMLGIERGLNRVYETPHTRNFIIRRMVSAGYTVLFVVSCVGSLLLLVLGNSINLFIQKWFPGISEFTGLLYSVRSFVALFLLVAVFGGLYTWLPVRKNKLKRQIPGALFATFGWIVFSALFSIYFDNFSNYSYMYGSLTAVVMLMLWLYICICILFLGAEINWFMEKMFLEKNGIH